MARKPTIHIWGIPRWVKCLGAGLAFSWLVALGHWFLIEVGYLNRSSVLPLNGFQRSHPVWSGEWLFDDIRYYVLQRRAGSQQMLAYGWPLPCWGALVRDIGMTASVPVVALNLRLLWPPSSSRPDAYQRFVPIFPLVGQLLLSSALWGGLLYAYLTWRDRRRPKAWECARCGYDLRGSSGARTCPECGSG